jgi:hypothetical protein
MKKAKSKVASTSAIASAVAVSPQPAVAKEENVLAEASDPSEPDPLRLAHALERHRAAFAAVPEDALVDITIDVASAAMLVLKMAPNWVPLKARIAALPKTEVDQARLDEIESVAEATLQAHAVFLTTVAPASALQVHSTKWNGNAAIATSPSN